MSQRYGEKPEAKDYQARFPECREGNRGTRYEFAGWDGACQVSKCQVTLAARHKEARGTFGR